MIRTCVPSCAVNNKQRPDPSGLSAARAIYSSERMRGRLDGTISASLIIFAQPYCPLTLESLAQTAREGKARG